MHTPDLKLIAHSLCPYVQRSVIVLKEKAIPYERVDVELSAPPTWFKELSPLGRVPLLLINGQYTLFESNVICEYLDESTPGSLHPEDILEKARHRSWIEFGSGILDDIATLYSVDTQTGFDKWLEIIEGKLHQLESVISTNGPYFSGTHFHLIDAVYAPIFRYFEVFDRVLDLPLFDKIANVSSWRQALQSRESAQQAVNSNYANELIAFLISRNSYISKKIASNVTA